VHDTCLALLHLARFRPIRKALLKLEVIPLLADIARGPYAGVSKQAVAALLQALAKADGGPEALTTAHGGVGAETLVLFAENGLDTVQEVVLDTLFLLAVAGTPATPPCATAGTPPACRRWWIRLSPLSLCSRR